MTARARAGNAISPMPRLCIFMRSGVWRAGSANNSISKMRTFRRVKSRRRSAPNVIEIRVGDDVSRWRHCHIRPHACGAAYWPFFTVSIQRHVLDIRWNYCLHVQIGQNNNRCTTIFHKFVCYFSLSILPAKLVAALLWVARVTADLAGNNGSLPPGLWLTSPAGWLPRTGISPGALRSAIEYGLPLPFTFTILRRTQLTYIKSLFTAFYFFQFYLNLFMCIFPTMA